MTHKDCKLGDVQRQDGAWGFVVRGEHGKLLFSLTYETMAEAEDARSDGQRDRRGRSYPGAAVGGRTAEAPA